MASLQNRIGKALLILGSVPITQRNADYRIAVGLVQEAKGYLFLRNDKQAERLLKASVPYMAQVSISSFKE